MKLIVSLFLLVALFLSFSFSAEIRCGIRCMLANATGRFSDIQIPLSTGNVLQLSSSKCKGFSLSTAFSSSINLQTLSGFFEATFLSSDNCQTSYSIFKPDNSSLTSGNSTLYSNTSVLSLQVRLLRNSNDNIVEGVEIVSCNASNVQTKVLFASTLEGEKALKEVFETTEKYSSQMICNSFQNEADDWTNTLKETADIIRQYSKRQPVPPPPDPQPTPDITDLTKSATVNILRYAVDDISGTAGLNGLLDIVTNHTDQAWANLSDPYVSGVLGGYFPVQNSDVFYSIPEGNFAHLSNWSFLKAVQNAPESNWTIISEAALEDFAFNSTLLIDSSIRDELGNDLGDLLQAAILKLSFHHPSVIIRTCVLINSTRLVNLAVSQYVDWQCLVNSISGISIPELEFNSSNGEALFARLELINGGDIEPEFFQIMNSIGQILSLGYQNSIVGLANGYYLPQLRDKLNNLIISVISNDWQCNTTTDPVEEQPTNFLAMEIVFGAAFALWVTLTVLVYTCSSCGKNQVLKSGESRFLLSGGLPPAFNTNSSSDKCLMQSKHIPFIIRLIIPLVVFCNMALFVTSNASVSARVNPEIHLGSKHIHIASLFNFGLINTVTDMWKAGVYPLSILVGLFSGVWPYVKLIVMVVCWVIPPSALAVKKRESILMILDALGKWSLVDAYVMALMVVAFHFHVSIPSHEGIPSPGTTIDLFVNSLPGYVIFVSATMLSLMTGHVITAMHRHSELMSKRETNINASEISLIGADKPKPLCSLAFPKKWRSSAKIQGTLAISFLLLCSLVSFGYGVIVRSLRFDIGGLAGWGLDVIHQNPLREYSLIDMAMSVPKSSEFPKSFNAYFILIVLLGTSIVVPVLHLLLLLFLWLVPLPYKHQRRLYVVVETLNAWSAIEVYTISIIVALLQIRQFAEFMVGDKCDMLTPILKQYFDGPLHGNDRCFDVVTKIETGTWVLAGACVMYVFAAIVVMRRCHRALAEREPSSQLIN